LLEIKIYNKNNIFSSFFLLLNRTKSHFSHRDIPSTHNGYCVRLYKEKLCFTNDFVNFLTWIKGSVKIAFSTEHNLTSIYHYFFQFFSIWRSALITVCWTNTLWIKLKYIQHRWSFSTSICWIHCIDPPKTFTLLLKSKMLDFETK